MEYIGFIAAILTTSSFAPQALKTIRTRNTSSISLGMYIIFNLGVTCWLIYGITISDYPIIFANAITLIFTGTILTLKLKYG